MQFHFSKTGTAKYFGHLEMANIFMRAMQRAGISVRFSQGFHPKPLLSFEDALPIGMESLCESMTVTLPARVKGDDISRAMNRQLPMGLRIHGWRIAPKKGVLRNKTVVYEIHGQGWSPSEDCIRAFQKKEEWIIEKTDGKGRRKRIDLKAQISEIALTDPEKLILTVNVGDGKTVRPAEVIKVLFDLPEKEIKQLTIKKIEQY